MKKGLKEVGKAIGGYLMALVTKVEKYFIGGIFIQSEGCQSGVEVADRQNSWSNPAFWLQSWEQLPNRFAIPPRSHTLVREGCWVGPSPM